MNIILKNGDVLKTEENATCMQAAQAISEGLARNAVCARVNGELKDLSHVLKEGDALEIVTLKDRDGLHVYRHTCAHVLAQALKTIYPTCKLSIGPVIDNGFYYDVDFTTPITMNGARQPMLCARMPATAVPAASPTDMEELYSPITEPQRDFLVQLVSMDTDTGA